VIFSSIFSSLFYWKNFRRFRETHSFHRLLSKIFCSVTPWIVTRNFRWFWGNYRFHLESKLPSKYAETTQKTIHRFYNILPPPVSVLKVTGFRYAPYPSRFLVSHIGIAFAAFCIHVLSKLNICNIKSRQSQYANIYFSYFRVVFRLVLRYFTVKCYL
jgi:hypothetical protein